MICSDFIFLSPAFLLSPLSFSSRISPLRRVVSQKYTEGRTGGLGLPKAIQENMGDIVLATKGCVAGGLLKSLLSADVFGCIKPDKLIKDMVKYAGVVPPKSQHRPFILIRTDEQVSVPNPHADDELVPQLILDFNSLLNPMVPQQRYLLSDPQNPVSGTVLSWRALILLHPILCSCWKRTGFAQKTSTARTSQTSCRVRART